MPTTRVMRALTSCAAALGRRRPGLAPGENGFALVEVLVSAVLLIVLALATFPVIDQAAQRASANNSRSVAANAAAADQQRMRQMNVNALANYKATTTKTVKGIEYTVRSRAEVSRDSTGVVACQLDAGKLEYFRITSTVTWANMSGVEPVVVQSVIAPGVAAIGPNKGTLTVRLKLANGSPAQGITVTAGGLTDVTDSGGCAVFALVASGDVPVTWSAGGYVVPSGAQTGTASVTVPGGGTANFVAEVDRAATATPITFKHPDDTTAASSGLGWRSVSAANAALGATMRVFTWGSPQSTVSATSLFPFLDGYNLYAGNCAGNDPSKYQGGYYASSPGGVIPQPGQTLPSDVVLPRYTTTVKRNNANVARAHVEIWRNSSGAHMSSACNEKVEFTTASVNTATTTSQFSFALPYGQWMMCVDSVNNISGSVRKRTIAFNNTPPGTYSGAGAGQAPTPEEHVSAFDIRNPDTSPAPPSGITYGAETTGACNNA